MKVAITRSLLAAFVMTAVTAFGAGQQPPPVPSGIHLEADGGFTANFERCGQIGTETSVLELLGGGIAGSALVPGRLRTGEVICERRISLDKGLWQWRNDVETGKQTARRNVVLTVIGSTGANIIGWNLTKAWPSRLVAEISTSSELVVFTADALVRNGDPVNPVITWNPAPLSYGTALGATHLNATANAPGSFVYNPPAGTILTAGIHTLSATFTATDPAAFNNATATAQVTVTRATLKVRASDKTKLYGAAVPPLTFTYDGFVNGETEAVLTGVPAISTIATSSSNIGDYPIVVSAGTLTAANYAFTFKDGKLSITPVPLSVTANDASRFYGAANPPLDGILIGLLPIDAITVSFTTAATPSSNVGTYPITPQLSDPNSRLGNYTLTRKDGVLTVLAAPLVASAANASRTYGSANPPLTGTLSGVVNSDAITVTFTTTATASSPAGSYPITPVLSDPSNRLSNYTVTLNNGVLSVQKALLTVIANDREILFGDPIPPLTVRFTGFVLGEGPSVLSGAPAITTIASPASAPGYYVIQVSIATLSATNYSFQFINGTISIVGARTMIRRAATLSSTMIVATLHPSDREKLEMIVRRLTSASEPVIWTDENRPLDASGGSVFSEAKDAVVKLTDLLGGNKSSLDGGRMLTALNLVVRACRIVAVVAIDDAVSGGMSAKNIDKARADLRSGDADAAARRYNNAVLSYRNAWASVN